MLMRLADVLSLSHKDRNLLLHSGGYTAAYSNHELGSAGMGPVLHALQLIQQKHDPYPALVMDGNYNAIMGNASQQRLMGFIIGKHHPQMTMNILEAAMSESAFQPYLVNWENVAGHLLRRLRRQILAYGKSAHQELFDKLPSMSSPANWQHPEESKLDALILTVDFKVQDRIVHTFSTLSQFGAALEIRQLLRQEWKNS